MPPTRTITPAKAVKTERTHEENQERAYIAASRRSDRSLEARVESARRASEIHKRRTGRSLRVTEQDVINEEMYEEEDDDLPLHYRRLTAHLQTGSVDFNRRLAAYLTNQVAMRSAMDSMINNSYAQQYPNAPNFAHNNSTMGNPMGVYPSPLTNNNQFMASPQQNLRYAPYPSAQQANNFRQTQHIRANSVATPAEITGHHQGTSHTSPSPHTPSLDARRMSMPATVSPAIQSPQQTTTTAIKPDPEAHIHTQSGSTSAMYPPLWQDHSMFSTTLPPESQQLLAPALDPNDPLTASLMAGSEQFMSNPHYPWSNQGQQGQKMSSSSPRVSGTPSFNGMSTTLAPSAFETGHDAFTATSMGQLFDGTSAPSDGLNFDLSQDSSQIKGMPAMGNNSHLMARDNSGLGSGQVTPGEGFWDSFIQDGGWSLDTDADANANTAAA